MKVQIYPSNALFPVNGSKLVISCFAKDLTGNSTPNVIFTDYLQNEFNKSERINITETKDDSMYIK